MHDGDIYDILDDGEEVPQGLSGRARVFADQFDVIEAMSSQLAVVARAAVRSKGALQLVLSPTALTMRMMRSMLMDPVHRAFPWSRTTVWFAEVDADLRAGFTEDIAEMLLGHGGVHASSLHNFDAGDDGLALEFGRRFEAMVSEGRDGEGADCAVIGLDGGWFESLPHHRAGNGVYNSCPHSGRRVLDQSHVRSCTTIIAGGTIRLAETIRSTADRVVHDHPGLFWFLSRAGLEESR